MWQHKTHFAISLILVGLTFVLMLLQSTSTYAQSEEQNGATTSIFLPLISNQQGTTDQTNTTEDYMIIEGDIQVPLNFFELQASDVDGTFRTNLWPNGIVPYEFDDNVTPENRVRAVNAMTLWQQAANVTFQPCLNNVCTGNYIHFRNSTSNSSPVGMIVGGQYIDIFNWNIQLIIAHELGHALGFVHEQSRSKRDDYVQINQENVNLTNDSFNINFGEDDQAGNYGPYDFDSVMHYGQCAFSISTNCPNDQNVSDGGRTIIVKAPNQEWQSKIGQRARLSEWDRRVMSFLYPQPNWRFASNKLALLPLGSFLSPWYGFGLGVATTPPGGTLWLKDGGEYSAVGTYNKPMVIRAGYDDVFLK